MKKYSKFMLALAFVAGLSVSSTPSYAVVEDGTHVDQNDVWPLMEWVEAQTGVKVPGLPTVTASGTRLKTAMGLQGIQQARSMAAYIPGQVIINHVIWDRTSVRSTSYLVHELVHHAQFFSNKKYACNNEKEREAYEMQNKWLAERGEGPIVTERFIKDISSCDSPV